VQINIESVGVMAAMNDESRVTSLYEGWVVGGQTVVDRALATVRVWPGSLCLDGGQRASAVSTRTLLQQLPTPVPLYSTYM
jgi:hypothetical protein